MKNAANSSAEIKSGWTARANKALYKTRTNQTSKTKDSLQTTNAKATSDWHHQWWDAEEQRTEKIKPSLSAILPPLLHISPCILHNIKQRKMVEKLQREENYTWQELPETEVWLPKNDQEFSSNYSQLQSADTDFSFLSTLAGNNSNPACTPSMEEVGSLNSWKTLLLFRDWTTTLSKNKNTAMQPLQRHCQASPSSHAKSFV